MRKYVGEWYVYYKFINLLWFGFIAIGLLNTIFIFFDIDSIAGLDSAIVIWIFIVLNFLTVLIGIFRRKQYEYNLYYEVVDNCLKVGTVKWFAYIKEEKTAPLYNVLDYKIEQNLLQKIHKIYRVSVNCGSELLKFYVEEQDIKQVENILKSILEENLAYRRYEDD